MADSKHKKPQSCVSIIICKLHFAPAIHQPVLTLTCGF